ncbi:dual oxidase maturation factor 1 [Megalopta genalis]|uniref:dual oxidase maturation factor 1 n=1 Tax=Megalopta genalis TaxID=115081 RepID=UPI001442F160|nr:dual oxidase maturation factor 1-like [Megalopta genalis]
MTYFSFGRKNGFPARYSPNETPVIFDITETIIILIFVIISISYLSIIPSYRKRQSIYVCIKVTFSITIGCSLLVNNFGQEWEVSTIRTKTPYKAGSGHEIDAVIGVKIGLRSLNVTLRETGKQERPYEKETINYNERFWWTWDQGKFGFGPQAGLLQRNFRDAQRRGTPIPILLVVEYFVIDGEGIRFGRFYRTAGWYCHILLWTGFATWILAIIFLQSTARYAGYFLWITGGLQILTCIVWCYFHNPTPLVIPFEKECIRLYFGRHFWMTLSCGMLCILLAAILVYMDLRYPNELSIFLDTDPLNQYDECVVECSSFENAIKNTECSQSFEMKNLPKSSEPNCRNSVMVLRRRSTIKHAQKSLFRCPVPLNLPKEEEKEAMYMNNLLRASISSNNEFSLQSEEEKDSQSLIKSEKVKGIKVMV